jgi:hypothetical protein
MAVKKPLVITSGQVQQLQAADTIQGAGSAVRFQYDTDNFETDPGAGKVKFNFPPPGEMYISATDADGNDVSDWIEAWDDGNGVITGKLFILVEKNNSLAIYNIFAGTIDNTGWYTVDVAEFQSPTVANGDYVRIWFQPQGNDGADGVSAGVHMIYSTTTTQADPGSGTFRLNNTTLASATALYISETDAFGNNVQPRQTIWDDLPIREKGYLTFIKVDDPATWVRYLVLNSRIDNGGWREYQIEHVGTAGTPTNTEEFVIHYEQYPDAPFPQAFREGMLWFRDGTDIVNDVAIYQGKCRDASDSDNMVFVGAGPTVKRLDAAWAAGNNVGGLDTGSRAANTWYWIWCIKNPTTGDVDILLSESASAPTMPSGYTLKRRVGAIRTNATNLQAIDTRPVGSMDAIYVRYVHPAENGLDVNVSNLGVSRVTYQLTQVPPFGASVFASVRFDANVSVSHATGAQHIYIANPDHIDSAPSTTATPLSNISANTSGGVRHSTMVLYANRDAQITGRSLATNTIFKVQTLGYLWSDNPG